MKLTFMNNNLKINNSSIFCKFLSILLLFILSLQTPAQTNTIRRAAQNKKGSILNKPTTGLTVKLLTPLKRKVSWYSPDYRKKDEAYLILNLEFDTESNRRIFEETFNKTEKPLASVFASNKQFADVFIKVDKNKTSGVISKIENSTGLIRAEQSGEMQIPPLPEPKKSTIKSKGFEEIVRGGLNELKGKSVIIAIIDTGVDIYHPDFIVTDENGKKKSRIAYLWDTDKRWFEEKRVGEKSPVLYPSGRSIGTVLRNKDINEEINEETLRQKLGQKNQIITDSDGHGTASASIAAGNGSGISLSENPTDEQKAKKNMVMGVAPEADIIAVNIQKNGKLSNAGLINGVIEQLDKIAKEQGKPLIISCSFGGQYGGRDGMTVQERHLSSRFEENIIERALVIAAGNNGADNIHSKIKFRGLRDSAKVQIEIPTPDCRKDYKLKSGKESLENWLDIYFGEKIDTSGVRIRELNSIKIINKAELGNWAEINPITGRKHFQIRTVGTGELEFYNTDGKEVEAYIYSQSQYTCVNSKKEEYKSYFKLTGSSRENLVTAPGTAENAITVGSYDWNDLIETKAGVLNYSCKDWKEASCVEIGKLSYYTSFGFVKDARSKPDVVAPGQWFWASRASMIELSDNKIDTSENYRVFNGTSAATPYVAGVIALMFEKARLTANHLTAGQVKRLFQNNAYFKSETVGDKKPNSSLGFGRLRKVDIEGIVENIKNNNVGISEKK